LPNDFLLTPVTRWIDHHGKTLDLWRCVVHLPVGNASSMESCGWQEPATGNGSPAVAAIARVQIPAVSLFGNFLVSQGLQTRAGIQNRINLKVQLAWS
jgi:hypothetical protein